MDQRSNRQSHRLTRHKAPSDTRGLYWPAKRQANETTQKQLNQIMLSCDINSPYFGQLLATIANKNQRIHNERMAQIKAGNHPQYTPMSIIEPAERKTHTAGEWTVIRTNVDDIPGWCVGVDRPSAHTEAFGFWTPIARINNKPDAQLISQSPQMLACLEAIRTAYDNAARHGHSIPSELVRAIGESAAITAKAKGWA